MRGMSWIEYFIAKSPSRGFLMLMYLPPLIPRSSSPKRRSSSSSRLDVLPRPENFGNVVTGMEHFCEPEKTSTSPLFVKISAAAG